MNKKKLVLNSDGAYLGDAPFYMAIGDIHYFRIYPTDWESRLLLAKDFGLNVIQTYVPWNLHEPKKHEFCFEGIADLDAFLSLCEKLGLYVFLRPSPYICSEWDLGGLPSWLLADRNTVLRSSDPSYLREVEEYYKVLFPKIKPHLSTNGGCILALAVENEYGSYGYDKDYLAALVKMYEDAGLDVPYYTTDGDSYTMMAAGSVDGIWRGVNFRAQSGSVAAPLELMKELQPDKPFFVGEWWSGRSMHWDEPFSHRDPIDVANGYKEALATGGYISFYMFSGGTNFGFMSGANYGRSFSPRPNTAERYIPHLTSYDEDALISEDGVPTEKYFLCRDALDSHLGKAARTHLLPEHKKQSLTVQLDSFAYLFDDIDSLTDKKLYSAKPKTMEDLGQDYGYILYSAHIKGYFEPEPIPLKLLGVRDRALVFINGKYTATVLRDREEPEIHVRMDGAPIRVDILVENMGRINYGHKMEHELKGILGGVHIGIQTEIHGFTTRTLPMRDLSKIVWKARSDAVIPNNSQVLFKGNFSALCGVDSFVDMRGFGDGFVIINGFNIGVYRACGPQKTLYVSGGLIKEENEIIIFDSNHTENRKSVDFIENHII